MKALKAATVNGSSALGRSDRLESVEAGKLADFVILNVNPLTDISNVQRRSQNQRLKTNQLF